LFESWQRIEVFIDSLDAFFESANSVGLSREGFELEGSRSVIFDKEVALADIQPLLLRWHVLAARAVTRTHMLINLHVPEQIEIH